MGTKGICGVGSISRYDSWKLSSFDYLEDIPWGEDYDDDYDDDYDNDYDDDEYDDYDHDDYNYWEDEDDDDYDYNEEDI